jgi:hypothetical protein
MTTILKTVVPASIGPVERKLGYVYVHDIELDGDEDLAVGQRVEVVDEGGQMFAATIVGYTDRTWKLAIRP